MSIQTMTSNEEESRTNVGPASSPVPLPARESIMFHTLSTNPRRISMGGDDYTPVTVSSNINATTTSIHSIPEDTTATESTPPLSGTVRENNVRYVSPKTVPISKTPSLSAYARRISLGSDNGGEGGRKMKKTSRVEDHSSAELVVADPCPIKPLAAYNMFFQMERGRLLQVLDESGTKGGIASIPKHEFTEQEIVAYALQQRTTKYEEAKRAIVHKRKHEKSHGKIGFQELARHIANGWKNLTENERYSFNNCYKTEMEHYKNQFIQWYQRHPDHDLTKEQANLLKSNGIPIVSSIASSRNSSDNNRTPTNTPNDSSTKEDKCEVGRTTNERFQENKMESITVGDDPLKFTANQTNKKLSQNFQMMGNTNEDRNQAFRRLLTLQAQVKKLQHPNTLSQQEDVVIPGYQDFDRDNNSWMMNSSSLSPSTFVPVSYMMNTKNETDDHLEEALMIEKLKRKKRLLQLRQEVLYHEQELAKQREILLELERNQGLLRSSGLQNSDETSRTMMMDTSSNFVSMTGLDKLEDRYMNNVDDSNDNHSIFGNCMNDELHNEMMDDDDEMSKNVNGSCDLALSTCNNVCYRLNSLHPIPQMVQSVRKNFAQAHSSTKSSSLSDFPSSAIVTPMTGKPMLRFPNARSSPVNDRQRFVDAARQQQQQQRRLFSNADLLMGNHRSRALGTPKSNFSSDNQCSNKWNIDEMNLRLLQEKFHDAIRRDKSGFDQCDDLSISGMSGTSLLRTEFQTRVGTRHREQHDPTADLFEPTELTTQTSTCPTITFDNGDNDDNEPMMFASSADRYQFFDPSSYDCTGDDTDSITTEMALQTTV